MPLIRHIKESVKWKLPTGVPYTEHYITPLMYAPSWQVSWPPGLVTDNLKGFRLKLATKAPRVKKPAILITGFFYIAAQTIFSVSREFQREAPGQRAVQLVVLPLLFSLRCSWL